jgi:hypothetical protein
MAIFSKLAIATASVAAVAAAPWEPSSKYSTHGTRMVSRDFHVETYHPENIYKTYGDGIETPLKKRGQPGTIEDSAASFVQSQLSIGAESFKVRSSASTDIGGHVYFQQVVVRETSSVFRAVCPELHLEWNPSGECRCQRWFQRGRERRGLRCELQRRQLRPQQ